MKGAEMTMKQGKKHLITATVCLAVFLLAGIALTVYLRSGRNILVAYFTRVGNTNFNEEVDAVTSASLTRKLNGKLEGNSEKIAKLLWRLSGGDLFAIESTDKYPQDYEETVSRASAELSENARPSLVDDVENMEQYDRIILVYPVWWGTVPAPVFSFLEQYNFSGKEILPIATHKGSFLGGSVDDIKETVPDANVSFGIPISGGSTRLIAWIPIILLIGLFLVIGGDFMKMTGKKNAIVKIGSVIQLSGVALCAFSIVRLLIL